MCGRERVIGLREYDPIFFKFGFQYLLKILNTREMNFNIIGYSIYIVVIIYITIFIGKKFHSNGRVFIHELFTNHDLCEAVNNILLVAYYLLNIGNAILMMRTWPQIQSFASLIEAICTNIGQIILLLAVIHYVNIILLLVSRTQINKVTIKH